MEGFCGGEDSWDDEVADEDGHSCDAAKGIKEGEALFVCGVYVW